MIRKKLKSVAIALLMGVSLSLGGGTLEVKAEGSTLDALSSGTETRVGGVAETEGTVRIPIPQSDQDALSEVMKELEGKQEGLKAKNPGDEGLGSNDVLFTVSEDSIEFNEDAFSRASEKSAKQNMAVFVDVLTDSQVSAETQQYIFDAISGANNNASVILVPMLMDSTKADLYTAMNIVQPFLSFMRVVFGLGAIVIVLLLATSTIIDLCYIGLPMARGDGKDGKPGLPFVSWDAESVVKEVESSLGGDGGYKNAYVQYFKRRVGTYIILAICLLYLVAGELGGVISWFLNLASGLI